MIPDGGATGLILSIACLAFAAARWASRADAADRLWVFVAAVTLQIGALTVVSSAVRRYDGLSVLVLQVALAGATWRWVRPGAESRPFWEGEWRRDAVWLAMLAATGVLLGLSAALQALTPIAGVDEQGYHAPRILYWLQNHSVFIAPTHDFRQTTFPFGAEMIAGWPLLFLKREWPMRMAFWLCAPLGAASVYSLSKAIGVGRRAAMAAALLLVATPTFATHAASLKSDAWLPLYLCGVCYWMLRADRSGTGIRTWAMAGLFLAMAVNVKTTALGLGPGLVLVAVMRHGLARSIRPLAAMSAGGLAGAAVTGLLCILSTNELRYGSPLGAKVILVITQPRWSVHQAWVHALRVPFTLAELPEIPLESVRAWIDRVGNAWADAIGATSKLEWEGTPSYPTGFRFVARPVAGVYGLGGMLWLPALACGLALAGRDLVSRARTARPVAMLAAAQLPHFLGLIFMVRWMNGGPDRFWLGAYALSIPLAAWVADRLAERRVVVAAACGIVLIGAMYPALRTSLVNVEQAVVRPWTEEALNAEFKDATPQIPAGSRVLLFAHSSIREYALFRPRRRFTNVVVPWGMVPLDPSRAADVIERQRITHIVVKNEDMASYGWTKEQSAALVTWLRNRPDLTELPLSTPKMRLFARHVGNEIPAPPAMGDSRGP